MDKLLYRTVHPQCIRTGAVIIGQQCRTAKPIPFIQFQGSFVGRMHLERKQVESRSRAYSRQRRAAACPLPVPAAPDPQRSNRRAGCGIPVATTTKRTRRSAPPVARPGIAPGLEKPGSGAAAEKRHRRRSSEPRGGRAVQILRSSRGNSQQFGNMVCGIRHASG